MSEARWTTRGAVNKDGSVRLHRRHVYPEYRGHRLVGGHRCIATADALDLAWVWLCTVCTTGPRRVGIGPTPMRRMGTEVRLAGGCWHLSPDTSDGSEPSQVGRSSVCTIHRSGGRQGVRPSLMCLPSSPEGVISLCTAVKLTTGLVTASGPTTAAAATTTAWIGYPTCMILLAKLLVGIHSCSQRSGSHVAQNGWP